VSATPITAVVAALPYSLPRGKQRVEVQRLHARYAVRIAAELAHARLSGLPKSADDVPQPSNGWHWSLSHSASSVAGIVHREPVGIDVEDRREIRAEVIERVLHPDEIALFEQRGEPAFLRAWTAKEALLKELGLGLAGLSECRVTAVDDGGLDLRFRGEARRIHQLVEPSRVVSVSTRGCDEVKFIVFRDKFRDVQEPQWS
jgi:4'-phosphopantetheinyl transferase